MTNGEMKSLIRKMNEDFWHRRDIDEAYKIYSDEIEFQRPPFPKIVGKEAYREADAGTLAAFSEIQSTINELVVEGNTVVAHWSWHAVHTGTLQSMGIPPTGKKIKFSGCSIYHFENGKIVKQWEFGDYLGFMQQLGFTLAPG